MAVKIWKFQAQQSLGQLQQSLDLVLRNQASKMKGALGGSLVLRVYITEVLPVGNMNDIE